MLLMLIIPIILTVAPVMVYQTVMLLGKKKSTSTHYVWTYIMMIYIWLVISVNWNRLYMGYDFKRWVDSYFSTG